MPRCALQRSCTRPRPQWQETRADGDAPAHRLAARNPHDQHAPTTKAAATPPNGSKLSDRAMAARWLRGVEGWVWPAGAVTRWSGSLQRVVRRRRIQADYR